MATLAGKDVVNTCVLAPGALVCEEGPAQDLIPTGPSDILIEGMPSRLLETVCIQSAPLNMATFSSNVMRAKRSWTRWSTGRAEVLYCGDAGDTGLVWLCAKVSQLTRRTATKQEKRLIRTLPRSFGFGP